MQKVLKSRPKLFAAAPTENNFASLKKTIKEIRTKILFPPTLK